MKLVVDFAKGFYKSLIIDNRNLDMTTLQYLKTVFPASVVFQPTFSVTNQNDGAARIFKIDNVIITDQEP